MRYVCGCRLATTLLGIRLLSCFCFRVSIFFSNKKWTYTCIPTRAAVRLVTWLISQCCCAVDTETKVSWHHFTTKRGMHKYEYIRTSSSMMSFGYRHHTFTVCCCFPRSTATCACDRSFFAHRVALSFEM